MDETILLDVAPNKIRKSVSNLKNNRAKWPYNKLESKEYSWWVKKY